MVKGIGYDKKTELLKSLCKLTDYEVYNRTIFIFEMFPHGVILLNPTPSRDNSFSKWKGFKN